MSKDYYKILGVDKKASREEIKQAYRRSAHKYHPDKPSGDEAKFKEVNEAYQVLSDQKKRAQYDQFGSVFPGQNGNGAGSWSGDFNFEDILRNFGGGFSGFEDAFFGNRRNGRRTTRKAKASDIYIDLELSLSDIYKGINKEIELGKTINCPTCDGSGGEPGSSLKKCPKCQGQGEIHQTQRTVFGSFSRVTVCPQCRGTGQVPEKVCSTCQGEGIVKGTKKVTVNVPFGVDDNQIIKLEGQGEAGGQKALPGDLYVKIHLKKDKQFTKKGDDVYYNLPISFSEAALGTKIEVPTLDGLVKLKIPAGIQSAKLLRLRGRGIAKASGGRGNQFVKIQVEVPKKLSRQAKELLKKLQAEGL